MSKYRFETLAVHGHGPDPATGAIVPPVHQAATYVMDDVGVHRGYEYSRTGNPTRSALEGALARLEGGRFGLAFASGMAAIDAVVRLLQPGDHVLAGDDLYGGTHRLFESVWAPYGLEFSYADLTDAANVTRHLRPQTRLVWLETPSNPWLRITDIPAVVEAVRAPRVGGARVLVAVDNTFAGPYLQTPLPLGADLVVHSTTKYLGGHNDVIGGAVVTDDPVLHQRLAFLQNATGAVPGPWDCWLVLRGMKTLAARMRVQEDNALRLAQFLSGHEAVAQVIYPGLPSHPQHRVARRQMRGFGGMISFRVHGGAEAAVAALRRVRLISLAESLGGVASLIEYPAQMSHATTAGTALEVDPLLLRLSVGLEHPDDLIADLAAALTGETTAVDRGRRPVHQTVEEN